MMAARHKPARRATTQQAHVPAPIGGINSISGASAMPVSDAIYAWNVLAGEYGLRVRMGWKEFANNLSGFADSEVRTILPFSGSTTARSRLFAVTSNQIRDVTAGGTAPTLVYSGFTSYGAGAGFGSALSFANDNDRVLLYCDEENGLIAYRESLDSWTEYLGNNITTILWEPLTSYAVGTVVGNVDAGGSGGFSTWECVTAGTSTTGAGPLNASIDAAHHVADGTVVWISTASGTGAPKEGWTYSTSIYAMGTSVADQNARGSTWPASFRHVCNFKQRLWFVEADSTRGWYLEPNATAGTATSFDFAPRFRNGGNLRGLYEWSYDGGSGMASSLVAISDEGDVVVYQGTDPADANDWAIKGSWSVGAIPAGRRIATEYGGDLLILSMTGIVSMSKLVLSSATAEDQTAGSKIANLFNQLAASSRRELRGWSIQIHPADNSLFVTVPTSAGAATEQLAMSYGSKGWGRYRDLPILSCAPWAGVMYFGTVDGQVCANDGYLDEVLLAAPTTGTAIQWSVLGGFSSLGNMSQKQVKLLRPILLGGSNAPALEATARYDYDFSEPTSPTAGTATAGWDYGTWDTSTWDGDYAAAAPLGGAVGMGRHVAIAVRGESTTRTVYVGCDVTFEQGGPL
jgi:hypothetical protein